MALKHSFLSLLAIVSVGVAGCSTRPDATFRTLTLEVQFVNYIQSGMPEQDVFVEPGIPGDATSAESVASLPSCKSGADLNRYWNPAMGYPPPPPTGCVERGVVVRPEPQDARHPDMLAKQVYAVGEVIPHDPYKLGPNPLGPFRKGDALGMTWREWLGATGSGTYTVEGDRAELKLSFRNLIPRGSYSLWCGRETSGPNATSFETPCDDGDGTRNRIKADDEGKAYLSFDLTPLTLGTEAAAVILLLSYDRVVALTEGEIGGYGLNNHVQLFCKFPDGLPPANFGTNKPARQE